MSSFLGPRIQRCRYARCPLARAEKSSSKTVCNQSVQEDSVLPADTVASWHAEARISQGRWPIAASEFFEPGGDLGISLLKHGAGRIQARNMRNQAGHRRSDIPPLEGRKWAGHTCERNVQAKDGALGGLNRSGRMRRLRSAIWSWGRKMGASSPQLSVSSAVGWVEGSAAGFGIWVVGAAGLIIILRLTG